MHQKEIKKTWLVTGGAGFIGSNFVLSCRKRNAARIITVDKLTYAGNLENLAGLRDDSDHMFIRADIADREHVRRILKQHRPDAIIHFAAETHVDRSILSPDTFIQTNILGTFALLEETRAFLNKFGTESRDKFRFVQISTDEVYGSLAPGAPPFTETSPYCPNSPYAASKAAADHLVRAYHRTYGFPAMIANCSNNFGPRQFPEKLIPFMIFSALEGKPLPLYGDGGQIRDWLYVGDTCDALETVLGKGQIGETYTIGGNCEKTNRAMVEEICGALDQLRTAASHEPYRELITFVADRPGHDRRYAMSTGKIERELGWKPSGMFGQALRNTIQWYLDNPAWTESVRTGAYRDWVEQNYAGRLPVASGEKR